MTQVTLSQGPAATIDPAVIKAALKKKAEQVIDLTVAPGIKAGADLAIRAGSEASAMGMKAVANYCGAGPAATSAIDVSMKGCAQATKQALEPSVTTCADKTANAAKRTMHEAIDRSCQRMGSFLPSAKT